MSNSSLVIHDNMDTLLSQVMYIEMYIGIPFDICFKAIKGFYFHFNNAMNEVLKTVYKCVWLAQKPIDLIFPQLIQ